MIKCFMQYWYYLQTYHKIVFTSFRKDQYRFYSYNGSFKNVHIEWYGFNSVENCGCVHMIKVDISSSKVMA